MLLKIVSLWKTSLKNLVLSEHQQNNTSTQNRFLFFKEFIIFSNFVSNNNVLFYLWFTNKNNKQEKKYSCSKQNYKLPDFEKSNQNTYLFQRPFLKPFQWVQKGDLISDCSASYKGELSLGKNLLVGYMPWEGLNFEDAVLINEKVVSKYISLHIEKYDLEIQKTGFEKVTRNIPNLKNRHKLDKHGIIRIGSLVKEGDILVGRIIPVVPKLLLTHAKLLQNVVNQQKKLKKLKKLEFQENSLRVPKDVSGRIIRIIYTINIQSFNQYNLKNITLYIAKKTKI